MQSTGPSSERGERSRRELTAIAVDCFARYGYQGTSIDRIARAAGVTKGAIYYHFRDKEALLAAAVADRVAEFEDRVQSACAGASPADALRRIVDVCVEHAESNDHPRFAITLMIESIDTNDAVAAELREMMRRFRAFLRNLVRDGQDQALFRSEIDADSVAASFTSSVLGAEIQYYQDPEKFPFRASLATFLNHLIDNLETNGRAPGSHRASETKE